MRRNERLFKNLQVEMFKKNINVASFARQIGISESSMRNKLKGRKQFKFEEICAILRTFPGLEWSYLFAQEEENPSEEVSEQGSVS